MCQTRIFQHLIANTFSRSLSLTSYNLYRLLPSLFNDLPRQLPLVNLTDSELAALICDPAQLADIVTLPPGLPLTVNNVSASLCGDQLDIIIMSLREGVDIGKVLLAVSEANERLLTLFLPSSYPLYRLHHTTQIADLSQNFNFRVLIHKPSRFRKVYM